MASPRLHHGAGPRAATVPLTPGAALIRERLAERRQELADECPEAVSHAALILEALHTALWGRAAEVSADRSPRYRRAQLAGERALPLEDLTALALQAPGAVTPAAEGLAALCGRRTVRIEGTAGPIHLENADVLRAFGEFEGALQEALNDGLLSARERADLEARLRALIDEVADLVPAIRETR